MKVKKYTAPTMPEAMKKIRTELGKDAVILNSKVVHTGGVFGFFTKKQIEVIAAIDPSPFESEPIKKESFKKVLIQKEREPLFSERLSEKSVPPTIHMKPDKKTDEHLLKEINELKNLINDLPKQSSVQSSLYPEMLQRVSTLLMEQEIDDSIQTDLMTKLLELWYKHNSQATKEEVDTWLYQLLFERVNAFEFGGISFDKQYINVVGPTGVGKTTTLAKIAANCVLKHEKKVAFITTDTYRIAAIDQLKTYAKILNVPIEVCYNMEDFKRAKEKFSDFDLVFVDTAGRNFRNQQYVDDLREVIDFSKQMETFLVLSLTAKMKDMREIYKQFSVIDIHRFIFTKVDETSQFGPMINLMTEFNKGVAYITTGQNVPDDIIDATPNEIVNIILGVDKR
jgi:flagellar biosynthesis protein FlhF